MPNAAIPTWYWSNDKQRLETGDRAFDIVNLKPGTIGPDLGGGWFNFRHTNGGSVELNGERVCSMNWAHWRYINYL